MHNRTVKILLIIISLTFLLGCTNGKIEYRNGCPKDAFNEWKEGRDAKAVYLINTSNSKKITFTVKVTEFGQFDEKGKIQTEKHTLNPGEEKYLQCSSIENPKEEGIKWYHRYFFEVVGELEEK